MSMSGETKHQSGGSPLEVFVALAKASAGEGAVELVKQALDANGVYTFTELIEVPSIQELSGGQFSAYWDLLQLFAYGTYKDYTSRAAGGFPELSLNQKKKLQHLTIITLSERDKCIPYKILLEELGIANVRELEDLIIEAIYSEIIQGKLDQRRALLEVDTTIGRDIRKEDISTVSSTLEMWCDACENVLSTLQNQVDKANSEKSKKIQRKDDLEQQINNLKKTLKHQSQDGDESYGNDSREALGIGVDKTPKKVVKKGGRGRGYFK